MLLGYFIIRKYLKFRKTLIEQESMLEEIGQLNREVKQLVEEKEKILAMKVSQLGLKPDEEAEVLEEEEVSETDVDKIDDSMKETRWLFENSYKFGFILRYPKGKEDITGYNYEPWHYRYVGNISEYLYKNNFTYR